MLFVLILCTLCFMPTAASADGMAMLESQVRELTQVVKDLKVTVDRQQMEIAALKTPVQPPAAPQPPPSTAKPSGKFTPEIGAVADTAMKLSNSRDDTGGNGRVSVRELELVLGSNVDPFSRLDATVAFNEDSTVDLEEAYLTRFELPFDTTARIGRFKPKIGRDLAAHRDSLDTVDEPLVIQRYFGEEGMNKSGVDLTKMLDIPSPFVHQLTAGVLEGGTGDGGTVFGDYKRRPTLYAHLKNYLDITDDTNLDLGLSYAAGHQDDDAAFNAQILGLDGTLIHHLNPIQDLKLQSEVFYVECKDSFTNFTDPVTGTMTRQDLEGTVWGGYALLDFRISSQWAAGFRFDDVELIDNPLTNPDRGDLGYTGYLTFYQSEFARWRAQFTHLDLANGKDDNQILLQGTFAIGDHKHKLQ